MKIQLGWLLFALTFAHAQSGLDRPRMGVLIDSSGGVRNLYGVPGSILLGGVTTTGALSVACSRQLCLTKTDRAILCSMSTSTMSAPASPALFAPAPAGPALFALDGDAAFVYFPASKQLARWHDGQLDFLNIPIPGEVLSIRAGTGNSLDAATRIDRHVSLMTISLDDGNVSVTGSIPPSRLVMLVKGGVLFSNRDGLVLRRPDATENRFDVKDSEAAFAMWDGYVEVRAGRSTYAIRIDPGHEQMFLLPEAVE